MTIRKVLGFWKGYQPYSTSEIVIRLQGQLNIDAGLVNQKWRHDVKPVSQFILPPGQLAPRG